MYGFDGAQPVHAGGCEKVDYEQQMDTLNKKITAAKNMQEALEESIKCHGFPHEYTARTHTLALYGGAVLEQKNLVRQKTDLIKHQEAEIKKQEEAYRKLQQGRKGKK